MQEIVDRAYMVSVPTSRSVFFMENMGSTRWDKHVMEIWCQNVTTMSKLDYNPV